MISMGWIAVVIIVMVTIIVLGISYIRKHI